MIGRIAADDKVDLVDVEELHIDAGNRRRIRLVVVIDQFDWPPEQATLGVDLLFPNLRTEQGLLAVGCKRTGERHAEAYLDRLPALRGSGSYGKADSKNSGAEPAGKGAPRNMMTHGFHLTNGTFRLRHRITHRDGSAPSAARW